MVNQISTCAPNSTTRLTGRQKKSIGVAELRTIQANSFSPQRHARSGAGNHGLAAHEVGDLERFIEEASGRSALASVLGMLVSCM